MPRRPNSMSIQIADPLNTDLAGLSDRQLRQVFDAADRAQEYAFVLKCKVVATYRANHVQKWGSSWLDKAREQFRRSKATLQAYANIWEIYVQSGGDVRRHIASLSDSKTIMQMIGRRTVESGKVALDEAVRYINEYGEVPTISQLQAMLTAGSGKARRKFGPPLNFRELRHEPINEQGVVLLFGMVARELGFLVEAVATGFPDCRAKRRTTGGRYEEVAIEFEFKASTFKQHRHDPARCDLLVCWENDWPDCPVDVIELRQAILSLPQSVED